MKVCIHRGTQEIGGTCIEIESGGKRIVLDLGLPLNADDYDDEESLLPPVEGFIEPDDSLLAIIISHPHQDHYGLSKYLRDDLPAVIGEAAHNILKASTYFTPSGASFRNTVYLNDRKPIRIGPFEITPFLVDHSAYDAYSLLIEVGGKRLFYSGDFRAHGRKARLFENLIANPPENIDVLFMEGTAIGRANAEQEFQTEDDLIHEIVDTIHSTKGMTLVWSSGQNIDRLVTIFKACKKTKRQFIIDMYTAEILRATGNEKLPQANWDGVRVFLPKSQKCQIIKNKLFHVSNKYKPYRIYSENLAKEASKSVMLFRPSMRQDLDEAKCLKGAHLIYSLWEGYLKGEKQKQFLEWLGNRGIPLTKMHTSGHASVVDLKRFAGAINPRKLVPIHSFSTNRFPEFFERVESKEDGIWWEV